jgi:hypothetical protein
MTALDCPTSQPFRIHMAARDPAQQGAAIQRRAQGAQQNFAQQLRFELGVQERFLHFLETFEAPDDAQEEGAEDLRKKTYADKARKMTQRGKDLLEVCCVDANCKLRVMQADSCVHIRAAKCSCNRLTLSRAGRLGRPRSVRCQAVRGDTAAVLRSSRLSGSCSPAVYSVHRTRLRSRRYGQG